MSSKKVLIFLDEMVEDMEFMYPYYRLKEEGHEVISAAPKVQSYTGKKGMPIKPDTALDEVKDREFDALIVPGGFAPDKMRRSHDILEMVKNHHQKDKWIVSICHGPWVLISAGITSGKRITATPAIKDDLINSGANYTGNETEEDGNILTSTNPITMLPMMRDFIQKL